MTGRLGHIDGARRVGHIPVNGIRKTNYAYGFGGCIFWLDADFGTNTKTGLAAVSSWKDRISNIEFSQSTGANQPRYVSSDAAYNNYPVIECVSNARFLISDYTIGLPVGKTVAIVGNYTTINNTCSIIGNQSAGSIIDYGLGGSSAGFNGVYIRSNGTIRATGTTESTSVKIGIVTGSEINVNGTQEVTYSTTDEGGFNQLFRTGTSSVNNLIGKVAEVLIFNTSFTPSQCIELSNRINSKYAIY